MLREHARKRLTKKAKKGFRGFPVATVAFYGPDDRRASKLTVGIVLAENQEAAELKRWFAEPGDVREDLRVAEEVLAYMDGFGRALGRDGGPDHWLPARGRDRLPRTDLSVVPLLGRTRSLERGEGPLTTGANTRASPLG